MINLKFSDTDNDKTLQISLSTPGQYVEIILGVLFGISLLIVAGFYAFKTLVKPNITTPRPIRLVRRNLTNRFGLAALFTPERQDQEPILDNLINLDAIANDDDVVWSNDTSLELKIK